jgi:hypothetical protein
MEELMQNLIGTVFPIIQCINNKDVTNPDNWEPCILKKERKDTYEVLKFMRMTKLRTI